MSFFKLLRGWLLSAGMASFALSAAVYAAEDLFSDLSGSNPEQAAPATEEPVSLTGFGLHGVLPRSTAAISRQLGGNVYAYSTYFADVIPDLSVFIGAKTVETWSKRFLKDSNFPVRSFSYEVAEHALMIKVVVDSSLLKLGGTEGARIFTPGYRPGEIFKPVDQRESFDNRQDGEQDYVVEIGIRLRFPLLGHQEDNTVYMEFSRQAARSFYAADYNSYLEKEEKRYELLLKKARFSNQRQTLLNRKKGLEREIAAGNFTNEAEYSTTSRLLGEFNRRLDKLSTELEELDIEVANFKSGSVISLTLSPEALRDILQQCNRQGVFNGYLGVELFKEPEEADGVVRLVTLIHGLVFTIFHGRRVKKVA
jgi:hypothetical protein